MTLFDCVGPLTFSSPELSVSFGHVVVTVKVKTSSPGDEDGPLNTADSKFSIVRNKGIQELKCFSGASARAAGAKPHTYRNWTNQRKPCIEIGNPCISFFMVIPVSGICSRAHGVSAHTELSELDNMAPVTELQNICACE